MGGLSEKGPRVLPGVSFFFLHDNSFPPSPLTCLLLSLSLSFSFACVRTCMHVQVVLISSTFQRCLIALYPPLYPPLSLSLSLVVLLLAPSPHPHHRHGMRAFQTAVSGRAGVATLPAVRLAVQARACATSSGSPASSPSTGADGKKVPTRRGFVSSTKFTLSPSQVTDDNVPTARDVASMIPSLKELKAQLPNARELESQYIGGMDAVTREATSPSKATIFQPTTDPLEDLIEGTANEDAPKPNRMHVLLAYRALFWGTFYAVAGVLFTVFVAMYCCGYHSLGELMDGVRNKVSRDEARLRASAVAQSPDGEAVTHYVIDLTHPSQAMEQIREIWSAVQDIADREGNQAEAESQKKE